MLKIWGRRSAFNVQKVMWLLGELEIPHQHIALGGSFCGLDTAEFLAINPHGRIPVIGDDKSIIWESHTILRYLAAKYGSSTTFWSATAEIRAKAEQWMDWMQTTLQAEFNNGVFWGFYRTPEPERDWPAIQKSIARCNQYFQLLDTHLKSQAFLAGNNITLADIPAGTLLYRYFELEIERPALSHVKAWSKRLQERPAYREHVMVPFNEMKGRLSY